MLRVACPAKLNLFLAVGPVDSRGYHPLRTIFQAIGLFDDMHIERAATTTVRFIGAEVPEENTVTKALRLAAEVVNIPPISVTIHKCVPPESGLGGGSSNAAGLLRALPKLTGLSLPPAELAGIASAIGADVSFFLVGGRAQAEGYGERLAPQSDPGPEWYVIARPEVGCPTGEMYRKLDALTYEWRDFPESDTLYNDFERVAPCECLDLTERLQIHGARDAALSGSGSAVFGRFDQLERAQRAAELLRAEGVPHVWVAPALTREQSLRIDG